MANKGPIKGVRIPVVLPWEGATDGKPQFVSMKRPIAELLGLALAQKKDLTYEVKVKTKAGSKTLIRYRRPGHRTRAIRVEFGTDGDGKPVTKKIGGKNVASFQFPITTSIAISDVIDFFKTGKGKNIGAQRIVDANSGQGYPVA